jgi:hypothetical protein
MNEREIRRLIDNIVIDMRISVSEIDDDSYEFSEIYLASLKSAIASVELAVANRKRNWRCGND